MPDTNRRGCSLTIATVTDSKENWSLWADRWGHYGFPLAVWGSGVKPEEHEVPGGFFRGWSEEGCSFGNALDRVIELCETEWVAVVHPDCSPKEIERLERVLERTDNRTAYLCESGWVICLFAERIFGRILGLDGIICPALNSGVVIRRATYMRHRCFRGMVSFGPFWERENGECETLAVVSNVLGRTGGIVGCFAELGESEIHEKGGLADMLNRWRLLRVLPLTDAEYHALTGWLAMHPAFLSNATWVDIQKMAKAEDTVRLSALLREKRIETVSVLRRCHKNGFSWEGQLAQPPKKRKKSIQAKTYECPYCGHDGKMAQKFSDGRAYAKCETCYRRFRVTV